MSKPLRVTVVRVNSAKEQHSYTPTYELQTDDPAKPILREGTVLEVVSTPKKGS